MPHFNEKAADGRFLSFINNYKLHSLEKTTHIYPSPGGSDKDVAFLKKFIQVSFSARDNRSQNASAEEALRC